MSSNMVNNPAVETKSEDPWAEKLAPEITEPEIKRKRENTKSTPRNDDFLPDFGWNKDLFLRQNEIRSENECSEK